MLLGRTIQLDHAILLGLARGEGKLGEELGYDERRDVELVGNHLLVLVCVLHL